MQGQGCAGYGLRTVLKSVIGASPVRNRSLFTQREQERKAGRFRGAQVEMPKAGGGQAHGVPCRQPWLFPTSGSAMSDDPVCPATTTGRVRR